MVPSICVCLYISVILDNELTSGAYSSHGVVLGKGHCLPHEFDLSTHYLRCHTKFLVLCGFLHKRRIRLRRVVSFSLEVQ